MRVLQVVRQFYPSCGGMQQYVFDLCESLLARGYEIDVLTLSYDFNTGDQYKNFEVLNIGESSINISRVNAIGPRSFFLPAISDLSLDHYDVIHIHGLDRFLDYFVLESFFSKKKRKLVFTTHGGIFHSDKNLWFKKLWFKTLSKLSLSKVDAVMACSKQDYELFSSTNNAIHLIENGVNLAPFKGYSNPCNYNKLLYVGGFLEHKRVDVLLKWFSKLDYQDLELCLVGDDSNRLAVESLCESIGLQNHVKFLGRISREGLIEQYKTAGIFVSSSQYEGFGLSIVEAMAAGCTLILEDNEAFNHFIKNSDTGHLIQFESDESTYSSLSKLTNEQKYRLSKACQQKAQLYDWEERVDRIVGVYGEH
ncbi:MAG: glycosyltransferase family 4 protein [Candidatus Cloacimonetes bacterium]|nr:glycosyltransferase family 4 protein [Candidatus Cloacimonadota bacterium]